MYEFCLRVFDALGAVAIGLPLAALILLVGVPALVLWAGWSRNRYCQRKDWRNLSRWY